MSLRGAWVASALALGIALVASQEGTQTTIYETNGRYCPRGYYRSYTLTGIQPVCQVCEEGFFCPGCPDEILCPAAAPGIYESRTPVLSPGLSVSNQTATALANPNFPPKFECLPGTYARGSGNYVCLTCRGTVILNAQGHRMSCNVGGADPEPDDACEPGLWRDSNGNCLLCPVGKRCPGDGTALACGPGQGVAVQGAPECRPCLPGYFATTGSCQECLPGTFQDAAGASKCKACDTGKYSGYASKSCGICPAGTRLLQEVCVPCSAGQYQDKEGQLTCSDCVADTYSAEGATMCQPCRNGSSTGKDSAASACHTCLPGFRWNTARQQCVICPSGTYSAGGLKQPTACVSCALGKVAGSGSGLCRTCREGHVPVLGNSTCAACTCPGCTAWKGGVRVANGTCVCPPGFYLSSDGLQCLGCSLGSARRNDSAPHSCQPCKIGEYGGGAYQTACTQCHAGFTTLFPGQQFENACSPSSCDKCPGDTVPVCTKSRNTCVEPIDNLPGAIQWPQGWFLDPRITPVANVTMALSDGDVLKVAYTLNMGLYAVLFKHDSTNKVAILKISKFDESLQPFTLVYGPFWPQQDKEEGSYEDIAWTEDSTGLLITKSQGSVDLYERNPNGRIPPTSQVVKQAGFSLLYPCVKGVAISAVNSQNLVTCNWLPVFPGAPLVASRVAGFPACVRGSNSVMQCVMRETETGGSSWIWGVKLEGSFLMPLPLLRGSCP